MAAKIRIMKLLQEVEGLAEVTHRRPAPRQPGLFLIQLRSHVVGNRHSSAKRFIHIETPGWREVPLPVKITHIQTLSVEPSQPQTLTPVCASQS